MTKSKLYKITAWRDNAVKIVLVQNEGSNADNPTYNKTIQFRLTESGDQLLTVPESAEIVLAIEKPDHSTDLISGYLLDGSDSDIAFDVKNTITSIAGIVKGEIRIITAQSVVKFYGVNFNIYGSVNDDGAIQSEQFDALIQALQKVINVTGDGEVANMDSVIAHGGTNPVASGLIYDYLNGNYYTKTESDNRYQQSSYRTNDISGVVTQDDIKYPSVRAVKAFLTANHYTEAEIDALMATVYSKTESDDKFALKSNTYTKSETYTKAESDDKFALKNNTYTKSEINAIQSENNKRFALAMTVAFDSNGVPVQFSGNTSFSAGSFSNSNITTVFIGNNVQLIQGGAFATCTNLTDVYVDKSQLTITIQEQAFPANATIHYMDGFNVGELIIAAIKYLNTLKANAADVYTKTEADNKYQTLSNKSQAIDSSRLTTTEDATKYPSVAAVKDFAYGEFYDKTEIDEELTLRTPVEFTFTLDKDDWENQQQIIDIPTSSYVITENTRVVNFTIENLEAVTTAWVICDLSWEYGDEYNNQIAFNVSGYSSSSAISDHPPIDIEIKFILMEVISNEATQ